MEAKKNDFTDLRVWIQGMDICEMIYKIQNQFPKEETYALGQQIRRAVVSIPSNIAEGHSKGTVKEFIQGLVTARGSNAEVQTQVFLSQRLGYITEAECEKAISELRKNIKGINKLISYLKTLPNKKPQTLNPKP